MSGEINGATVKVDVSPRSWGSSGNLITPRTKQPVHLPVRDGAQSWPDEKREQKSRVEEKATEEHEAPGRDPRIVPPSFQISQVRNRSSSNSRRSSIHS